MLVIYAVLRDVKKTKPKTPQILFWSTRISLMLPESVANAGLPTFNYFEEALKPFLSKVL